MLQYVARFTPRLQEITHRNVHRVAAMTNALNRGSKALTQVSDALLQLTELVAPHWATRNRSEVIRLQLGHPIQERFQGALNRPRDAHTNQNSDDQRRQRQAHCDPLAVCLPLYNIDARLLRQIAEPGLRLFVG